MAEKPDFDGKHVTTRRGFVTALGFGVVSLYGLWAAYGAAPTSLKFLTDKKPGAAEAVGHGHGGPGEGGMSAEEFRRLTDEFIEANSLPDGSVKPSRRAMVGTRPSVGAEHAEDEHAHEPAAAEHAEEEHEHREAAAEHAPEEPRHEPAVAEHAEEGPIEVYLMAYQWGYEPDVLRLEQNVPYRFRMMAMETYHGASINFGGASRIIRLPPGRLVEQEMKFTQPGEYTVYCTVYCGLGHDFMRGSKIIVE